MATTLQVTIMPQQWKEPRPRQGQMKHNLKTTSRRNEAHKATIQAERGGGVFAVQQQLSHTHTRVWHVCLSILCCRVRITTGTVSQHPPSPPTHSNKKQFCSKVDVIQHPRIFCPCDSEARQWEYCDIKSSRWKYQPFPFQHIWRRQRPLYYNVVKKKKKKGVFALSSISPTSVQGELKHYVCNITAILLLSSFARRLIFSFSGSCWTNSNKKLIFYPCFWVLQCWSLSIPAVQGQSKDKVAKQRTDVSTESASQRCNATLWIYSAYIHL